MSEFMRDIFKPRNGDNVRFLMREGVETLEGIYVGEDDNFYFIDDDDNEEQLHVMKNKVIAMAIPAEENDNEPEEQPKKPAQRNKKIWG